MRSPHPLAAGRTRISLKASHHRVSLRISHRRDVSGVSSPQERDRYIAPPKPRR